MITKHRTILAIALAIVTGGLNLTGAARLAPTPEQATDASKARSTWSQARSSWG